MNPLLSVNVSILTKALNKKRMGREKMGGEDPWDPWTLKPCSNLSTHATHGKLTNGSYGSTMGLDLSWVLTHIDPNDRVEELEEGKPPLAPPGGLI